MYARTILKPYIYAHRFIDARQNKGLATWRCLRLLPASISMLRTLLERARSMLDLEIHGRDPNERRMEIVHRPKARALRTY